MLEVPFVDLKTRVASLRDELDAGMRRVVDSGWFILGREVEAFERELAAQFEAREAVAVANGTEALQLSLTALGLGPGDEVITSSLSAAFTALAILSAGARPVFVDVDPQTLTLDPEAVVRAVTARTRAILPVHLYGHPADMDSILACAREHGLAVVEDACQAHGARHRGRVVGTLGACGALSFYPTKNLGALGDGGAILVGESELAHRLRRLRNGGQIDRYRHEEPGINSRLDEVQAAILRVGLRHLPTWTSRRRELAALYRRELEGGGVGLPVERDDVEAVDHLFVIRHPRRDALMAFLRERGIGTLIHYPIPLHLQPAFAPSTGAPAVLPVVEKAAAEILSLPLYPELSDEQAGAVVSAVRDAAQHL
jgi:dTDP-3-amino-3,4,6-trideoxy-alpha-D-glucose transaminase